MNRRQVTVREVDGDSLARAQAPDLPPTEGLDGPLVITDEHDSPILVVGRLDAERLGRARRAALAYARHASTTYRSSGVRNRSRTFGFLSAAVTMRRDGCRACNGATEAPAAHRELCDLADPLSELVAELAPEPMGRALGAAEQVAGEWRLAASPWTSGVLNIDSAMPYHRDGNNLPGVWSAMLVLRRGIDGGHLHLPQLDVVLPLRDGDVVAFPGADLWHAVTPFHKRDKGGYRLTAVYYAVAAMVNCGEPTAEAEVTAERRTAREGAIAVNLAPREPVSTEAPPCEVTVVSHARADDANRKTLRLLAERGVPREWVRLFVTPGQEDDYRRAVDPGLVAEILPGALGLPGQRRAVHEHYPEGTRLVCCDDDLTDLVRRVDEKHLEPVADAPAEFARAFAACEEHGARLWGIYPVANPMFMKPRVNVGLPFCIGHLWGVINAHDRTVELANKEDYERTLRYYDADGAVIRLDDIAARTRMFGAGGLQADDQEERGPLNEREVDWLLERWPTRVRVQARTSKVGREIRLVPEKRLSPTS